MKHTTFTIALLIANNYVNAEVIDSIEVATQNNKHIVETINLDSKLFSTNDLIQQNALKTAFFASPENTPSPTTTAAPAKKQWYDNIQMRGYAQVRYNRLLETNPLLKCEQCDRSIGDKNGFSMRRLR